MTKLLFGHDILWQRPHQLRIDQQLGADYAPDSTFRILIETNVPAYRVRTRNDGRVLVELFHREI